MIPRTISSAPQVSHEVFGFVMTTLDSGYTDGIATVTMPGSGRFATVRAITYDGIGWLALPGTLETGYAGLRDAERHMFARTGMDNHQTVVSAQGTPTAAHPDAYAH